MDSFFCGSIGEQRSKPFWYDIPLKNPDLFLGILMMAYERIPM